MIERKGTFFLGFLVFLLPFIGVPNSWKTIFMIVIGVVVIASSIRINLPKRISKSKPKKEKQNEINIEATPIYPKDNIIVSPEVIKTASIDVKPERKRATRRPKQVEVK